MIDINGVAEKSDKWGEAHTAANLIFEKRNKSCEIVIILFEYCNFACTFCPQDHNSKQGMDYESIVSKADLICEYINQNNFASDFVIRLIGGEPFNDEIIVGSDLMKAYRELADRVRAGANLNGRRCDFIWISNFSMIECREDVLKFMEEQKDDTQFVVSYDLKGRFNKKNLETFKENIEIFAPYIRNINSVITKQNIEALLAGDEYYDYLYSRFDYSWDQYIKGDSLNNYAIPLESQVLEFYKVLADKYPRVEYIVPFLREPDISTTMHTLCSRGNGAAIDWDNKIIPEGCVGSHYLRKFKTPAFVGHNGPDNFIDNTLTSFLDKYNCHACEYYQRCPMMCFSGIKAGNMIQDMDTCINKELFKYVDSKRKSNG